MFRPKEVPAKADFNVGRNKYCKLLSLLTNSHSLFSLLYPSALLLSYGSLLESSRHTAESTLGSTRRTFDLAVHSVTLDLAEWLLGLPSTLDYQGSLVSLLP